jgi:hypothetical protein
VPCRESLEDKIARPPFPWANPSFRKPIVALRDLHVHDAILSGTCSPMNPIPPQPRPFFRMLRASCVTVLLFSMLPSCAKDDLQKKMDQRNAAYSDYNDRRSIRRQARQERTDMWFDRQMGKPPKTDTGLRLPPVTGD